VCVLEKKRNGSPVSLFVCVCVGVNDVTNVRYLCTWLFLTILHVTPPWFLGKNYPPPPAPDSAVVTGETEEGRKLLERGIIISNATLRFMPKRDSAGKEIERIRDSGLLLLAEAVKVGAENWGRPRAWAHKCVYACVRACMRLRKGCWLPKQLAPLPETPPRPCVANPSPHP
jgi:hypothetical protein